MKETKKRSTKLGNESHENSVKLRQEVKDTIDDMLAKGEKITKTGVARKCNISRGLLYSPEMDTYINAAIQLQEEQSLNLPNQETNLYRKLMASYIFQYSLLEEQEALLNEVISNSKSAKGLSKLQQSYILNLLAYRLRNETDKNEILYAIETFPFENDIPDWKRILIEILEHDSNGIALQLLRN